MDALSAQLSGGIAASTLLRHWDRLLENHLVADLTEAPDAGAITPVASDSCCS